MSAPIRVLIADDSATIRAAMADALARFERIVVVGSAADGEEAVAEAHRLQPDVITMDLRMPKMDGLQAISEIMSSAACRILVVCALSDAEVGASFRAIELGAMEVIAKPSGGAAQMARWAEKLAESIRLMAEVPVVTRHRCRPAAGAPRLEAVGVVSSTGGPPALVRVLSALPADLAAPILVAQHLSQGFGRGLARWLTEEVRLRVVLAGDGEALRSGTVYLAGDGQDLEVRPGGLLRVSPSRGRYSPCGDALLSSLADVYGARAGGIILTGMGDDGTQGLLKIRRVGGMALAQDAASCVVFGMPQAAWVAGAAERLVPLAELAEEIRSRCGSVPAPR
jgi:two-component system chemotaxis response regulator CheB